MPPEALSLADYQSTFAARIRDPRAAPLPPGASARRMRVYQDLLFNNLQGFLLACYPVTRKILGARAWQRTTRRFFAEHRAHSPLFRDIPRAFLDWLAPRADALFPELPFLAEFMHYEWLELAVSIAPEDTGARAIDPAGDLMRGRPALNPTARLACYRFPMHRVGPRCKPAAADGKTHCYLLFRAPDDAVRFIRLEPLAARLLDLLRAQRPSGREALAHLAAQTAPDAYDTLLRAGAGLLEQLRAQGALIGTWRDES